MEQRRCVPSPYLWYSVNVVKNLGDVDSGHAVFGKISITVMKAPLEKPSRLFP